MIEPIHKPDANVKYAQEFKVKFDKSDHDPFIKVRILGLEGKFSHITISYQRPRVYCQEATAIPFNMVEQHFKNALKETYSHYRELAKKHEVK